MSKSARKAKKSVPARAARPAAVPSAAPADFAAWTDRVLAWGLGLLCLFISICFYTGTYDTAFVKITLLQMGALALGALWLALLAVQKRCPITRHNLPWLLPFLVYFGWNFLGYALAPYKVDAFEECLRYGLYFGLMLVVLDRFDKNAVRVLIKCLIGAAWISCLYGLLQVADRWLPGADFLPWRGFFGTRIFSTHANPNFFADFLVFSSFIVLAEYVRTRSKRLLVLLAAAVTDLFFTESKGAWLGFAASGVFFAFLYIQGRVRVKKYARGLYVAAGVLLLGAVVLAGAYAARRFQSVSFRAYTWAATLDMVQDSPVLGTGVGSFKTIYPAYRKPQIFYLEKVHNNETQHAENEYLEQWATAGTVGLAVFLWMVFFVLYVGWRGLRGRERWDESAWMTLGLVTAFFGICVHNVFDISIRFVSTGLFFAVFAAAVVRLNMPPDRAEAALPAPGKPWLLGLLRAALCAAVAGLVWYVGTNFAHVSGNIGAQGLGGAFVKAAAWVVLVGLVLAGGWMYVRAAFVARWARVPAVLLLSLLPLQGVFGFFLSDHEYGIAAEFSRRMMWDGALDYYHKAIKHNPFLVSYRQYRAYILRATMELDRSHSTAKGDSASDAPMNDYERALRDLDWVRRHAPNNALLYQAYGEFYYTYAVHFTRLAQAEPLAFRRKEYETKAVENMELAKQSFRRSLLTDPVHEATYMYLTSIALMERNAAQARQWIEAYRRGPERVTEEEFLRTHRQSARLDQLEQKLHQPPFKEAASR